MGALDMITKAPEFQAFQAQLRALLAMVQDTNARVRKVEGKIDEMHADALLAAAAKVGK